MSLRAERSNLVINNMKYCHVALAKTILSYEIATLLSFARNDMKSLFHNLFLRYLIT